MVFKIFFISDIYAWLLFPYFCQLFGNNSSKNYSNKLKFACTIRTDKAQTW